MGENNLFKLGRHESGLGVAEHRFDNVFEVDACGEPPSVAITASANQADLVLRISGMLSDVFRVIYVLLVPFGGYAEGRYEFTERFDHESLKVFLDRYREFFERDARHHLVVGNLDDTRKVVYDQHNFICVVRPTDQVFSLLEGEGFQAGSVALPIPHSHHHHAHFDAEGAGLLNSNAWTFSPLLDTD